MLAVAIIINNYLHDMATGVFFASMAVMWAVLKLAEGSSEPQAPETLRRIHQVVNRLWVGALVWIIIGGIPRTIFFSRYEWDPSVAKGIVPALLVKHVMLFAIVGLGFWLWSRVRKAVAALPMSSPASTSPASKEESA